MSPELFSEEQREIAKAARDFSAGEVMTRATEIEAKKPGLMPELLRKAGDLGLLMADIPSEYGGLGLEKTTSMLIAEQFSRLGAFAVSVGAHTGIGTMPILYFGTHEQKAKYLPDLATGRRFAAYALTETGSGSDALAARTRADLTPDGKHYVLNGTKQFITNAGFADVFTVFAQIDGGKFTGFIVDRNMPGLHIGPEEHKLGIRGSSTCPLSFEDLKVPAENVLGEIGKGHRIAFNILNVGRIKLGLGTIGGAKCALGVAARYAKERQQFGKPIGSFGLVAGKLSEMAVRIFVGETIGYRTTGLMDERCHGSDESSAHVDAIEEFAVEASIIKVVGSEVMNFCADETVQIHGGYGYIEEYEAERLLRDSRIHRIFEGTNEINRLIVPGTILKRAMKGQAPLLQHSAMIRERLAQGQLPEPGPGEFAAPVQAAEFCKWMTVYTLAVAAETYSMGVADEQEILGTIADMISTVYAMDSVVARVRQITTDGKDEMNKAIARDIMTAFIPGAYRSVFDATRSLLSDMSEGDTLAGHLAAISKLNLELPAKVIAAKRRIAKAVLETDGYPIRASF